MPVCLSVMELYQNYQSDYTEILHKAGWYSQK